MFREDIFSVNYKFEVQRLNNDDDFSLIFIYYQ